MAPTVTLANGVRMPRLGLGTWPMTDAQAATAVAAALRTGYRLIDTAENYRNEHGVGTGIRAAGVDRAEVFVTSKFNRRWHSVDGARKACIASLSRLELDYLDLFLVHWPNPEQDRYVEAFDGLVRLLEAGLVRAIGVSNFKPAHLHRLFDAGFTPHVNQIHLHPYRHNPDPLPLHRTRNIVTQTWSPLAWGTQLLSDPAVAAVADRHGRTPAQVVLRWHTQQGFVPIPRSLDPQRQAQNLDTFGFTLSESDMCGLGGLHRHDPDMLDADNYGN